VDLVRAAAVARARGLARRAPARSQGTVQAHPASPAHPYQRPLGAAVLVALGVLLLAGVVRAWGDVSAEFLATSAVVALVPGTGVVYTVSSSLGGGGRRGLLAAAGCTLGIVPHLVAAMLGLSGVMQAGAVAFEVVRWAGVAYLVVMGVGMLRESGGLRLDDRPAGPPEPPDAVVRRAVLLNLLNPKLTVFFLAFLPQFLATPPGLLDPRLLGLGAVFMATTLAVFAGYAWLGATVRERVLGAPGVVRWIQRSMGALVVGFAARLAVSDN
jgi:threonine/homoserine/homoserine lactone efflux protein